jgi:DNA-binding transcriptional MerR regulator
MFLVDQIPIGKFSFMTRLSQKALRLYDRKGLLVPEEKNSKG